MKLEFKIKLLCACCKHEMEEDIEQDINKVIRVRCKNPDCERPHAVYVVR